LQHYNEESLQHIGDEHFQFVGIMEDARTAMVAVALSMTKKTCTKLWKEQQIYFKHQVNSSIITALSH